MYAHAHTMSGIIIDCGYQCTEYLRPARGLTHYAFTVGTSLTLPQPYTVVVHAWSLLTPRERERYCPDGLVDPTGTIANPTNLFWIASSQGMQPDVIVTDVPMPTGTHRFPQVCDKCVIVGDNGTLVLDLIAGTSTMHLGEAAFSHGGEVYTIGTTAYSNRMTPMPPCAVVPRLYTHVQPVRDAIVLADHTRVFDIECDTSEIIHIVDNAIMLPTRVLVVNAEENVVIEHPIGYHERFFMHLRWYPVAVPAASTHVSTTDYTSRFTEGWRQWVCAVDVSADNRVIGYFSTDNDLAGAITPATTYGITAVDCGAVPVTRVRPVRYISSSNLLLLYDDTYLYALSTQYALFVPGDPAHWGRIAWPHDADPTTAISVGRSSQCAVDVLTRDRTCRYSCRVLTPSADSDAPVHFARSCVRSWYRESYYDHCTIAVHDPTHVRVHLSQFLHDKNMLASDVITADS